MNEQEAAAAESSNVTSLDSAREKILSVGPNEENDDGYELDPVDEESLVYLMMSLLVTILWSLLMQWCKRHQK